VKSHWWIGALILGALIFFSVHMQFGKNMENPVKVLFPTKFLIPSNALLNPHNTETIWEYYLLENLSCGLVLDDSRSPDGFRGCLSS